MSFLTILSPWIDHKDAVIVDLVRDNIPVDLEKLAQSLDLIVRYDSLDNDGYIRYNKGLKPVILINSENSENRKRVTLAHEIARYLLKTGDDSQLDYLAADIIMPIEKVYAEIKENNIQNISVLARKFGVSERSMAMRLNFE